MTATDPDEATAQPRLREVASMHQLRTPLQAVMRFAEVLLERDGDLDPLARRRALEAVVRHAARAVRTVEDAEGATGIRPETPHRPETRSPPGSLRLFLGQFGDRAEEESPGRPSDGGALHRTGRDRRSSGASSRRAKIEGIELHRRGDVVTVRTELSMGGMHVHGEASGGPTLVSTLEAVAEATLHAVEEIVNGAMRLEVDEVRFESRADGHLAVRVRAAGDGLEQTLVGVALIRGDPHRAALKATLAAVNRRMVGFVDLAAG